MEPNSFSFFVKVEFKRGYSNAAAALWPHEAIPPCVSGWPFKTGFPPATGWYNASITASQRTFRYFNGQGWSEPVGPSKWGSLTEWKRAQSGTIDGYSRKVLWRNIKPYRDGEEWDFLRE